MQHESYLRVRFGETDLLGHVNNASYFSYLEDARIQFFKELDNEKRYTGYEFILATIKCDFVAQTYFDQELTIVTKVTRIGNSSFTFAQPIYDRETGKLLADGESVIVYYDFKEEKSKPLPTYWRERLEQYMEKVAE